MEKQKAIQQAYDSTAQIYDARYRDIQFQKYRIMLADLDIRQPILDHGCGTGLLQSFLAIPLFGVDISLEMLKKGNEKAVQGDLENLPFKNNSFATVLSFTAIQNVGNLDKALAELKRILKNDGFVVLTFLQKFTDKIQPAVEKYFDILEVRYCGEDVGFILS
jgi:ubiquinone/menaquinone biosynthesis C-methylase UbiE